MERCYYESVALVELVGLTCLVGNLLRCLGIRTFVPSTSHVVFNYARLFEHNIFCKVAFQVATAPLDVRTSAAEVCETVSS